MSAKRLKATAWSYPSQGSVVPIPSFDAEDRIPLVRPVNPLLPLTAASPTTTTTTTMTISSENKQEPEISNRNGNNNDNDNDNNNILTDLQEAERKSILSFSGAIEMLLFRFHSRRVPLHACYELMDKTEGLTIPVLHESNETEWKTEKELFLYKFLYVASAARLYQIRDETIHAVTEMNQDTSSSSSSSSSSSRAWYIRQCTPKAGESRRDLNDVRTVLFDPTHTPCSCDNAQDLKKAVLSLRPKQLPLVVPVQTHTHKEQVKTCTTDLVVEGSTVEDRIRAKREKRRREEQNRADLEDRRSTASSQDEDLRLRIADFFWHRSREVLHRIEKFASPQSKGKKTSPCSFILSDALKLLVESQPRGFKLRKRQIVELLKELCLLVPEWIRRSPSNGDASSDWLPNDTLWIESIDYQPIRLCLRGMRPGVAPHATNKDTKDDTAQGPPKKKTLFSNTLPDTVKNTDLKSIAKKAQLSSTKELVSAACSTRALALTTDRSTAKGQSRNPVQDSACQLDHTSTETVREKEEIGSVVPPVAAADDPGLAGVKVNRSPPRERRRLRINPHLIWSDADYHGGEYIVLSRKDSPRGLRNLFRLMKAGKRI